MCNCSFDESDKIEIVFFTRIFGFLFVESHHMLKRSCLDVFIGIDIDKFNHCCSVINSDGEILLDHGFGVGLKSYFYQCQASLKS